MTEEAILCIINTLQWKFAKTMAYWPHWYTVRQSNNKELNEMYIDLYNYIKDNHYIHVFHGEEYKYCDIGEYSYWIMDDDIDSSEIINRAKKVSKT